MHRILCNQGYCNCIDVELKIPHQSLLKSTLNTSRILFLKSLFIVSKCHFTMFLTHFRKFSGYLKLKVYSVVCLRRDGEEVKTKKSCGSHIDLYIHMALEIKKYI